MRKKRSTILAALEAEKKKIERRKQLLEEREKNIELIEVEAKERSLRKAILSDSVQSFEHLLHKVHDHKKPIRQDDEWTRYLNCENLPDTKIPSEVRSFLFKWQASLSDHWDQQINWWLHCDSRSLLTQDLDRPDERRVFIQKLRDPIGKFYDQKLRSLLRVYNTLLDALRRKKMSTEHYGDLITIRDDFRETMFKLLNVLMFEVIMHVDREMTSVNPIACTYSYAALDFIKFIWTFKDVQLPPNFDKQKLIKMEPLCMNVTISNRFDMSSSVVRGLWFKHDLYTDHCPSFHPTHELEFIDLNSAVSMEMSIKKTMIDKHLKEMKKVRDAYEQMMEERRLEEEKTKTMKGPKPKEKASKVRFVEETEPPVVDETTHIDVEEEYLEFEDAQVEKEREGLLPENIGLAEHEINMRQHQITNGVFKIECFERPSQTQEINYRLFLRLNETPNIVQLQKFHHIYKEPKLTMLKTERKSQFNQKVIDAQQHALAGFMKVEVKLNSKFFWWESPTVCRWEPWQESEEFTTLDSKTQDFNLNYDEHVKKESEKLFTASEPRHYKKNIELNDFDLRMPPTNVKLSVLMKNYLVPMMPEEFKCFNEQLMIFEQKQKEWKLIMDEKKELEENGSQSSIVNLKEFFNEPLAKLDIRNITIEEFKQLFREKTFQARSLFPVELCNLIKVLENSEIAKEIQQAKTEFEALNRTSSDVKVDIGEGKPLQSEPLLLSELLQQVENVKESLRPFFKQIEVSEMLGGSFSVGSESNEKQDQRKSRSKSKSLVLRINGPVKSLKDLPKTRNPNPLADTKASILSTRPSKSNDSDSLCGATVEEKSVEYFAKDSLKLIQHHKGKWSSRDIYDQSYDAETKTVTFLTGRLGTFGFATRKYSNLPFKNWEVFPSCESVAESCVVMKVETRFVTVEFRITSDGYTFKIISKIKMSPPQEVKNPVKVFELKRLLTSMNLNLFPEIDAGCYIDNISEKHKPMELHTYKSMAVYCLSHHFKWSKWNRWAHRRVAVFESRMIVKKTFKTLMVTPLKSLSVNVREKCTELDTVELDFDMNPPEQEFHPDLLDFLKDEVDKREHRANLKNFKMMWFVQALMMNIQPLSFSH